MIILDSAMASKMKNIDPKKLHFCTLKMVFIQKNFMVSRRNQTLCIILDIDIDINIDIENFNTDASTVNSVHACF